MKVLDLVCRQGHVFEGWFGSEADYQDQHARGLISCPLCGEHTVQKKPSAPRLNLASRAEPPTEAPSAAGAAASGPSASPTPAPAGAPPANAAWAALHQHWLAWARQVTAQTENVGTRFAEEARRIHEGEAPERGIRGQATPEQCQALQDEGIEVLPLPPGLFEPHH